MSLLFEHKQIHLLHEVTEKLTMERNNAMNRELSRRRGIITLRGRVASAIVWFHYTSICTQCFLWLYLALSYGPTHFTMPIYVVVMTENSVKVIGLKNFSARGNPLLISGWVSNPQHSESKISLSTTVVFSVLLRLKIPLFITYSRKCVSAYEHICARNTTQMCAFAR